MFCRPTVVLFCFVVVLQVDLSREAANLQRFNQNFKRARAVSSAAAYGAASALQQPQQGGSSRA
jgi:predicted unusual protein kinase regulating ubiquinone biosynthesis (AarF/ABC1/UbiB family)